MWVKTRSRLKWRSIQLLSEILVITNARQIINTLSTNEDFVPTTHWTYIKNSCLIESRQFLSFLYHTNCKTKNVIIFKRALFIQVICTSSFSNIVPYYINILVAGYKIVFFLYIIAPESRHPICLHLLTFIPTKPIAFIKTQEIQYLQQGNIEPSSDC